MSSAESAAMALGIKTEKESFDCDAEIVEELRKAQENGDLPWSGRAEFYRVAARRLFDEWKAGDVRPLRSSTGGADDATRRRVAGKAWLSALQIAAVLHAIPRIEDDLGTLAPHRQSMREAVRAVGWGILERIAGDEAAQLTPGLARFAHRPMPAAERAAAHDTFKLSFLDAWPSTIGIGDFGCPAKWYAPPSEEPWSVESRAAVKEPWHGSGPERWLQAHRGDLADLKESFTRAGLRGPMYTLDTPAGKRLRQWLTARVQADNIVAWLGEALERGGDPLAGW
jgi:hypothetical protein